MCDVGIYRRCASLLECWMGDIEVCSLLYVVWRGAIEHLVWQGAKVLRWTGQTECDGKSAALEHGGKSCT